MAPKVRPPREALTPEFGSATSKLVWALRALLFGLGAYALLVEPDFTTRPLLAGSALSGLAASLAFAFVATHRSRTLKAAEAAVLAAVAFHVMGHAFGWYAAFRWYDAVLHFVIPLATALVLFALSQAIDWVWDWRQTPPAEIGVYLFAMSVTLGALWEVAEFAMDQLAGTKEQDDLFDTMMDLLLDVVGAAVGAVVGVFATRSGRARAPLSTRRPGGPRERGRWKGV